MSHLTAKTLGPLTTGKALFLDIVAVLNAHGIAAIGIPAKREGLNFGPSMAIESTTRHTLLVANLRA